MSGDDFVHDESDDKRRNQDDPQPRQPGNGVINHFEPRAAFQYRATDKKATENKKYHYRLMAQPGKEIEHFVEQSRGVKLNVVVKGRGAKMSSAYRDCACATN